MKPNRSWKEGFGFVKIVKNVKSFQFQGITEKKLNSVPRQFHSLLFSSAV